MAQLADEARGLLDDVEAAWDAELERKSSLAEKKKLESSLMLIASTLSMMADQVLDAGVIIELTDKHWYNVATVLVLTIIVPQIIGWAFLKTNGMAEWNGLLRQLAIPSIGAAVLGYLWFACLVEGEPAIRYAAIFCLPLSLETVVLLYRGLKLGGEVAEAIWSALSEGLIEAPASACLTLYTAMLMSAKSKKSVEPLFLVSFIFSVAMITKNSTKLHFYGMSPSPRELGSVALLQKFPQIFSQALGFVFFSFLTRPLPHTDFDEELEGTNEAWPVFFCLLQEVTLNCGILRMASPKMPTAISMYFATTMVFGSPPGFLSALDEARVSHAMQHLVSQVLMGAFACHWTTDSHWVVLRDLYLPFLVVYAVAVPWSFFASVAMSRNLGPQARRDRALALFDDALDKKDKIMLKLLLDVEQVARTDLQYTKLEFVPFNPLGCRSMYSGYRWGAPAECAGLVYFSPLEDTEIMVLDPGSGKVSFVPTGRPEGGAKWWGAAACAGRVYFSPHDASEIMVLDPASGEVSFVPTGRPEGGQKWRDAAACAGRVYFSPFEASEIMVLDPSSGYVSFVPTGGPERGRKWDGAAACAGRVYFSPCNASEIMVLDPGSGEVSFVPTGKPEGGAKWVGAPAECAGRVYFSPFQASEIMVLDPGSGEVSFVPTGRPEGLAKWWGAAACAGRVFFCPSNESDVMVLDPASGEVSFASPGYLKADQWIGATECAGHVYFSPCRAAKIMCARGETSGDRCRALGVATDARAGSWPPLGMPC